MPRYAEGTQVPISRSRDEIDRILTRFGAGQQAWLRDDDKGLVTIAFKRQMRAYRFIITMPKLDTFRWTPSKKFKRADGAAHDAQDAEFRRRFRSLANYLKALLDAIDTGIIHAEEALLPYLLLPSGATVAQQLEGQIGKMLESGHVPHLGQALEAGDGR